MLSLIPLPPPHPAPATKASAGNTALRATRPSNTEPPRVWRRLGYVCAGTRAVPAGAAANCAS
jgi:hypothetical protein